MSIADPAGFLLGSGSNLVEETPIWIWTSRKMPDLDPIFEKKELDADPNLEKNGTGFFLNKFNKIQPILFFDMKQIDIDHFRQKVLQKLIIKLS